MKDLAIEGKTIYYGLESSGKTYLLARTFWECMERNIIWYKKYGIKRIMAPNFPLNPKYEEYLLSLKEIEYRRWEKIEDVLEWEGCDFFIDEMLLYFDAVLWKDLSLEVKKWITQGAKSGNHIYGACQDFSQVAKSMRLVVNNLYRVNKILGNRRPGKNLPPLKPLLGIGPYVWGWGRIRPADPKTNLDDEQKSFKEESIFSIRFFIFQEKYTRLFNTNTKLKASDIIWREHKREVCRQHGEKCLNHETHR